MELGCNTNTFFEGVFIPFTSHSIANFVTYDKCSTRHHIFLAVVTIRHEPRNFNEAMKSVGWREAMQKEIRALDLEVYAVLRR